MQFLARIISSRPPERWLDYGAGDAEVYRFCRENGGRIKQAVLYEPNAFYAATAERKLTGTGGFSIVSRPEQIDGQFDLITACEVLEHLPFPERIAFYRIAAERLAPGGKILIEVPVEYGPILLLKEFGRVALKGRKSTYGLGELAAALFGKVRDSQDRYNSHDARTVIYHHYGFDIERFGRELRAIGSIRSTMN
ncbi:MAG: class I SAM-dependent methyltransferase [Croceibacterium sp.]